MSSRHASNAEDENESDDAYRSARENLDEAELDNEDDGDDLDYVDEGDEIDEDEGEDDDGLVSQIGWEDVVAFDVVGLGPAAALIYHGERLAWRRPCPETPPPDPNRFPKVPSEAGRKLMGSGAFGAVDRRQGYRRRQHPHRKHSMARRMLDRELGLSGSVADRRTDLGLMAQGMIPSSRPEMVVHYGHPVCCGQFSEDGNFFYACVKDYKVRLYDTSSPYDWAHYKTVSHPFASWTLTDAGLSPDNRWLAFSSLDRNVCITPTDPQDRGDPYSLDLADGAPPGDGFWRSHGFAIFSVRFSGDGRTLVAGTNSKSIVVYDIERRKSLHHVVGHDQDVNAVCFADKSSPHLLYSGSDDCTIKIWDTRSMGDQREAGAFFGHIEGVTYIDTKGDGRYVLSNAKDQSMKLWDSRMALSTADARRTNPLAPLERRRRGPDADYYEFDYRWQAYDEDRLWFQLPGDNSLVTFRGHTVNRTLIRCHFSPPGSSDSRYVYSGSADGGVYVWNMDATLAARIDVEAAAGPASCCRGARAPWGVAGIKTWSTLVRDVGWHPNAPLLVASSWVRRSGTEAGVATLHSYNENETDEAQPRMGLVVDEKLQQIPLE